MYFLKKVLMARDFFLVKNNTQIYQCKCIFYWSNNSFFNQRCVPKNEDSHNFITDPIEIHVDSEENKKIIKKTGQEKKRKKENNDNQMS